MHFSLFCFTVTIIVKVMSQSSHLPWEPTKWSLRRGAICFSYLKDLHFIISYFPSCLFPSIVNDIHIIGSLSIISFIYEHFWTKLSAISKLFIQFQKCVTWSHFGSSPNYFNTPSHFTTPSKGIKVFGVPFGISSFTSSFIKYAMLKDVRHVNLFPRMGDV